ncbi:MAG: amino acid adenylation domain-containing protein [Firmicutes bacterium]|nr:amino acid adenylation domain-containing protein [Bacillota bacterium]
MQINVLDYLEQAAVQFPHKPALIDETENITFAQLEFLAKAIGSAIIADNQELTRSPIVVPVERTAKEIAAFMGILYSGNIYVPLDAKTPRERLQRIFTKLKPARIICTRKQQEAWAGIPNLPPCLIYEEIINTPINDNALTEVKNKLIDLDPVYIIYTSGSTGTPKGIVVPHRNVIDLTEWLTNTFAFTGKEIIGNQTPFYFDASVKDIYLCLKNAMTMVIIPRKLFMFPLLLVDYLNEHRITTILWATSAVVLVANSGVLAQKTPQFLQKVFFAGEAMSAKYLNLWRQYLPEVMYINLYGPTEITVDCTYYIVERRFADDEPVPIGRACRNMEVFLLDENNRLIQGHEPGEICVRGTGVALGYYSDPERTKAVFVQNPLHDNFRDIIYRTGDIGRYNEKGELIFCCRKDDQIKHQGHRIELGEIELAVSSIDGVKNCLCFYDQEQSKIVLQYVGPAEKTSIIGTLRRQLPKYMLPSIIEKQESFPYNANGKIDRKRIMEAYYAKNS